MGKGENAAVIDKYNPYLGLWPFDEKDSGFFFGRHKQIESLFGQVKRQNLTVLYGRSGYGKTSLLKAGLFPLLRENGFFPVYYRLNFEKTDTSILSQFKSSVESQIKNKKYAATPSLGALTLWEYFHRLKLKKPYQEPVLVLDQFEEIFTLGKDHGEMVKEFLIELGCAIQNWKPQQVVEKYRDSEIPFDYGRPRVKVILSLRDDYIKDLEELSKYIPQIRNEKFRLHQMNAEDAYKAIYLPAKQIISENNARRLLQKILKSIYPLQESFEDLKRYEIEPFLLSLICFEVSSKRPDHTHLIDQTLVEEVNVDNIIEDFYLQHTRPEEREHIESLVSDDGVRIPRYRNEFINRPEFSQSDVDHLRDSVSRLINDRILRETEWNNKIYLELIHDVLIPVVQADKKRRLDKKMLCHQSYEKGNTLLVDNKYQSAYEHYLVAQESALELKDHLIAGQAMEKLGVIRQKQTNFREAVYFYEKALGQFKEIKEHGALGRLNERLAMYYEEIESLPENTKVDLEKIIQHYKIAEEHYRNSGDDMGAVRVKESIEKLRQKHTPWGYLLNLKDHKIEKLMGDNIHIGRNTNSMDYATFNEIDLPNSYVSRRHVKISRNGIIEDLHSTNGTTINGKDLPYGGASYKIQHQDVIGLAGCEAFQYFEYEPETEKNNIPDGAWAVLVQSNQPAFLYGEHYSIRQQNGELQLIDQIQFDNDILMNLEFRRNVELFRLNKDYLTDLLVNDYSPRFIWEFSKHLLLNVFSEAFFEKFTDWLTKNYGQDFGNDFLEQMKPHTDNPEFYNRFSQAELLAWNFNVQPTPDPFRLMVWYNRSGIQNWNPSVAPDRICCSILVSENALIVAEDQSYIRFADNEWKVIYLNKQEKSNNWYKFHYNEWVASSYSPAMCSARLTPEGNDISEWGQQFQIIQLNKF
ncbi:FHA domain-containing protein [Negadavirga shengliensis]|uniref:FHA domain-containing protein n=1 Tax=Negadavirga shengliensis TaxID=1389218 RepID=A0ABV9SVA1_9BACT